MQKQSTSFVLPNTSVEMTPLRKEKKKKSGAIQELGQRLVEYFFSSLHLPLYSNLSRYCTLEGAWGGKKKKNFDMAQIEPVVCAGRKEMATWKPVQFFFPPGSMTLINERANKESLDSFMQLWLINHVHILSNVIPFQLLGTFVECICSSVLSSNRLDNK